MTLVIEDNVPLPNKTRFSGGAGSEYDVLIKMWKGQSFKVDFTTAREYTNKLAGLYATAKRRGIKVQAALQDRKADGSGHFRVWRKCGQDKPVNLVDIRA